MLLGNRTVLQKSPATFRNGTSTAGAYVGQVINNLTQSGRNKNIYVNDQVQTISRANAVPTGYTHPYNFVMPQNNGGMASFKQISGSISASANIAGGKNAASSLSAQMTISNADMGLIINLAASLSAAISATNAGLAAVLNMIADLLSATGALNTPILGAISGVSSSFNASISLTSGSMANSIGHMNANILPYTELSPESLAAALLNSLLAEYNDPGTVGEALNSIGTASNPWSSDLSSNNTPGSFGARLQQILTLAQYMGINK